MRHHPPLEEIGGPTTERAHNNTKFRLKGEITCTFGHSMSTYFIFTYVVHVCMSVGCSVATTRAKDATLMIVASTPDLTRTELQLTFKIARATKLLSLSLSPCFSEVMAAFLC